MGKTYHAEQPRKETAPSAENRQYPAHDRRQRRPEGNLVRDEHPLGHLTVRVERIFAAFAQDFILIGLEGIFRIVDRGGEAAVRGGRGRAAAGRGTVQLPHGDGVEVELGLALGA